MFRYVSTQHSCIKTLYDHYIAGRYALQLTCSGSESCIIATAWCINFTSNPLNRAILGDAIIDILSMTHCSGQATHQQHRCIACVPIQACHLAYNMSCKGTRRCHIIVAGCLNTVRMPDSVHLQVDVPHQGHWQAWPPSQLANLACSVSPIRRV